MRLSIQNSKNWFLSKSFLKKNLKNLLKKTKYGLCQGKEANGLIANIGVE